MITFFFKFYRINRSESVKIWIWYNFVIFLVLFIFKMWPSWISCECEKILDINFFIMHEKAHIFMWLSSTKGFQGLSLLMECDDWIGKILCVRWAWGKMRSVFYITWPLTLLMYLLAEENKAIRFIQGSAHLTLDHSALKTWRFEYYSTWVLFWCGFYRWGRSCAKQIKKNVCQTGRKCPAS